MNNKQRRARIYDLKKAISEPFHNQLIASLRYNYYKNLATEDLGQEEKEILDQIKEELSDLSSIIQPLFEEMRSLQIAYGVNFNAELTQHGVSIMEDQSRILYLSTELDIDTGNQKPDYSNEDVYELISEINLTFLQEYSHFTISSIKRLK